MRASTAIYPFCSELLPFAKLFEKLQNQFALTKLISPSGLALSGCDAAYSRNQSPIGMTVTDHLSNSDSTWDVLWLARIWNKDILDNTEIIRITEQMLGSQKSIFFFDRSRSNVPEKLWSFAQNAPERVRIFAEDMRLPKNSRIGGDYCSIETPVVFIGGLIAEADTFEVLLQLSISLRARGYSVMALTNQPIGKALGMHTMRHILDNHEYTEAQKTLEINHFVRDLEQEEYPDIILLEAPGAIIRYNEIAPNGFGIQTHLCCQAVHPDYFICCVPCDLAVGRYVEAISQGFRYRLGASIDAIHVSNLIIDSFDVMQSHEISYVHTDWETVRKQIAHESSQSEIPFYNIAEEGADKVLDQLFRNLN